VERIEADPDWQEYLKKKARGSDMYSEALESQNQISFEKIEVFEKAQDSELNAQTAPQINQSPAPIPFSSFVQDKSGAEEDGQNNKPKQP
jgi:hypothetical protein